SRPGHPSRRQPEIDERVRAVPHGARPGLAWGKRAVVAAEAVLARVVDALGRGRRAVEAQRVRLALPLRDAGPRRAGVVGVALDHLDVPAAEDLRHDDVVLRAAAGVSDVARVHEVVAAVHVEDAGVVAGRALRALVRSDDPLRFSRGSGLLRDPDAE